MTFGKRERAWRAGRFWRRVGPGVSGLELDGLVVAVARQPNDVKVIIEL